MKRSSQFYATVYTASIGVLLKKVKDASLVEYYCEAYDEQTKRRKKEHDGYYYKTELFIPVSK